MGLMHQEEPEPPHSYLVSFDHIGDHYDIEPATFELIQDGDELSHLIFERYKQYLANPDEVYVITDTNNGTGAVLNFDYEAIGRCIIEEIDP